MRRVAGWLSAIVCLLSLTCSPGFAADPSSVPILLYHRLGPVSPDEMTVTTPVFEAQLKLIQQLKIPVTLFIYPSAISNADYAMTWAQLAEMKASGLVDIQSHTFWHPNFNVERKRLTPAAYEK